LIYFLRGLPLGDAVWFNASNNSGILYGDPLYSPVAVRLNPLNDTDTVSGVVDLTGSTVNGRDATRVSAGYAVSVCPGEDFFTCDQDPTAWQSTGISGLGGGEEMRLGSWDTTTVAPGPYTLRLAVGSLNTVTGRFQVLYDYYPIVVNSGPDFDEDGVPDTLDNCTNAANGLVKPDAGGNSQLDADGDGYGNICDADLNQDGIIDNLDLGLFGEAFWSEDPVADLDGDGIVDFVDLGVFGSLFSQPPGPSCCGTPLP
jgi:hypothetical protein